MKKIIAKRKALDSLKNIYKVEKEKYFSSIRRKYILFDIFDKDIGGIALILHILMNFGGGIVTLILIGMISELTNMTEISNELFFGSLAFTVLLVSGTSLILCYKEGIDCKKIEREGFPKIKEMKNKLDALEDEYQEILSTLNIQPYINMSLKEVGDLSVVEQNIIKDYKKKLEETQDGEVFKILNENRLKNTIMEVV